MDRQTAYGQVEALLSGTQSLADTMKILSDWRIETVTSEELVGAALAMRDAMKPVPGFERALDTCGTGGAKFKSANVSTLSALALAGQGTLVAKHGNRSVTRPSGSADLLELSGYPLTVGPEAARTLLHEERAAFLFAPNFHPAMRHVQPARQALGKPTIFNLLGPLCNPAVAKHHVLGVGRPDLMPIFAEAVSQLGTNHTILVHGVPGFDEPTGAGPVQVVHVRGEEINAPMQLPALPAATTEALGPAPGLAPARELLAGRGNPAHLDALRANMALGLMATTDTQWQESLQIAREILESGVGNTKWDSLVRRAQTVQHE